MFVHDCRVVSLFIFCILAVSRSRGVITADATIVPSKVNTALYTHPMDDLQVYSDASGLSYILQASLHIQLVESAFSFGTYPAMVSGFNYEPVRRHRYTNSYTGGF